MWFTMFGQECPPDSGLGFTRIGPLHVQCHRDSQPLFSLLVNHLSCLLANTRPLLFNTWRFQLSAAATEGEIYRYVAQSFKAFEQSSHAIANEQSAKPGGRLSEGDRDDRSGSVHPSDNSLLCRGISSSMGTALGNGCCIDFEPLEEAVDR